EVFHVSAPMTVHIPFALEMCQRVPQACAAASDHLRVEIVYRFGGLYADGDLHLAPTAIDAAQETEAAMDGVGYRLFRGRRHGAAAGGGPAGLPDFSDGAPHPRHGFKINFNTGSIPTNEVVVPPAGHPAGVWGRGGARHNYLRDQRAMFGAQQGPSEFDAAS